MGDGLDELLDEQATYYRTLAPDYLRGSLDLPGLPELDRAVTAFAPSGDVLEPACGPGTWTARLLATADSVTAVDGSAEMLALARAAVGTDADRVSFVHADLFTWRPARRFDAVFLGFWLSHVPLRRFAAFWDTVDRALVPGGRVLFVDDAYRTPDELTFGDASETITRTVPDGRSFRAVKVPHTPESLQDRLTALGWDITVSPTAGPFYWGTGTRRTS